MRPTFAFSLLLAALPVASAAQVPPPPGADHPMAELMFDVEDARQEAEAIEIRSVYCRPPYDPTKDLTQWEIDFVSLRVRMLLQRFARVQRSFRAAGTTRLGGAFVNGFPVINGLPATHRDYWPSARRLLSEVEGILRRKQRQLDAAPERDCAPPRVQQPPGDPQPPPDPMADLRRPVARALDIPDIPTFFCTEADRTAFLLRFNPIYVLATENAEASRPYRAEVSRRGAANFVNDGNPALQRRLDAEERWADRHHAQQLEMVEYTETIRQRIRNTPIVDCTQPEYGQAPERRTSVTVTTGVQMVGNPAAGTVTPLPPGQPFTAANGSPSAIHPSWSTSAGVALLREVLEAKGVEPTAAAIDAILGGNPVTVGPGLILGALLSRPVTDAVSVWAEIRIGRSSSVFSDVALAQADATRASVNADLTTLFADTSGAFVDSTLLVQPGGGAQVTIGAGVEYCFMDQTLAGWHPSVRAGIGVTWHTGDGPSLTLAHDYGFPIDGLVFHETDTVVVSVETYRSFGLQMGGALRRPLSDRMEFVIDVGVNTYRNGLAVDISAAPMRDDGGSSGAAAFPVVPTIQFGKGSAPSSLGGDLDDFTGFRGTGWRVSPRVAAGLAFKF